MLIELTSVQRKQLNEEGYLVLNNLLSRTEVEQLNSHLNALWEEEGEKAGSENINNVENNVRRLANLVNKGDIFRPIFSHSLVLEAVKLVLGSNVNLAMLNARDVLPNSISQRQNFHCDNDPEQNGGVPDERGYLTCTAIWMLNDFTADNGATRVVPGTHRSGKLPKQFLHDPSAHHPEEIIVTGNAGDVCVVNGNCWHCGSANRSYTNRCALLAHYIRADLPRAKHRQQHLAPEVKQRMSLQELQLLGIEK